MFVETRTLVLVVHTNLGSARVERKSCEARAAQGSSDAQAPDVPAIIVCQFFDGISPRLCRAFQ